MHCARVSAWSRKPRKSLVELRKPEECRSRLPPLHGCHTISLIKYWKPLQAVRQKTSTRLQRASRRISTSGSRRLVTLLVIFAPVHNHHQRRSVSLCPFFCCRCVSVLIYNTLLYQNNLCIVCGIMRQLGRRLRPRKKGEVKTNRGSVFTFCRK